MNDDIKGVWVNKLTGQQIIVDDMIIDGDNMLIKTSTGIINGADFSMNYIKMSEADIKNNAVAPKLSDAMINSVINQGIDSDMQVQNVEPTKKFSLDEPITNNTSVKHPNHTKQVIQKTTSETPSHNINYTLIEKVFTKMETEPQLEFNTNLDEWPINELKMLTNVLDVSIDDISEYIITNYLNKETLIKCFSKYLKEALENNK